MTASKASDIRKLAEAVLRLLDAEAAQSRVADGTNISIKLEIGTVTRAAACLGLEEAGDAGEPVKALVTS